MSLFFYCYSPRTLWTIHTFKNHSSESCKNETFVTYPSYDTTKTTRSSPVLASRQKSRVMNPNIHFTLTDDGVYNTKSLQALCSIVVTKQIKTYIDINKPDIPNVFKQNIREVWKDSILYCDEQLPEYFEYEKIYLNNPSKIDVVAIMQSDEILPCLDEDENHIVFEYYWYEADSYDPYFKRICTRCAMNLHKHESIHINRPDGWIHCSGKRLNKVTYPLIHDAEDTMKEFIWKTEYWCDNCAIKPLFRIYFLTMYKGK